MKASDARVPWSLEGHVALVTGANHGIGAATARALADCGAVLVSYLRTLDPDQRKIVKARIAEHARARRAG